MRPPRCFCGGRTGVSVGGAGGREEQARLVLKSIERKETEARAIKDREEQEQVPAPRPGSSALRWM